MEFKVNKARISSFFDLPTLGQASREKLYVAQDATFKNKYDFVQRAFIFGIEVEVENVPNPTIAHEYRPYWDITVDNSLRNNGVEFVSIPLKCTQIEAALHQLNTSLPKDADFSPRTSVHVHMNVRDLSIEHITNLLLTYTAVEELLFDWAGETRTNNVFCVRLTDTDYVNMYRDFTENPRRVVDRWNKYTALNFHPMECKGTVEFRHMEGTANSQRIMTWINLLSCIKLYAKQQNITQLIYTLQNLNSTSEYEAFLFDVFGTLSTHLIPKKHTVQEKMENAISYIKLATINREIQEEIRLRFDPEPRPIPGPGARRLWQELEQTMVRAVTTPQERMEF